MYGDNFGMKKWAKHSGIMRFSETPAQCIASSVSASIQKT